jgi:hypothetical protein
MIIKATYPNRGILATKRILIAPTKQGLQGLSAYQVAVQNGFVGTESEWLDSLVGETLRYTHTQASPLATWTIPHNLGRKPVVQIFTIGGIEVEAQFIHLTDNTTQIIFDAPFSGIAILIA